MGGKRGALCKNPELLPIAFRVLDDMKVRERKERMGEGKGEGEERRGSTDERGEGRGKEEKRLLVLMRWNYSPWLLGCWMIWR
jgi:hypothetical protein